LDPRHVAASCIESVQSSEGSVDRDGVKRTRLGSPGATGLLVDMPSY